MNSSRVITCTLDLKIVLLVSVVVRISAFSKICTRWPRGETSLDLPRLRIFPLVRIFAKRGTFDTICSRASEMFFENRQLDNGIVWLFVNYRFKCLHKSWPIVLLLLGYPQRYNFLGESKGYWQSHGRSFWRLIAHVYGLFVVV